MYYYWMNPVEIYPHCRSQLFEKLLKTSMDP